jgi:DNA repair protein SbcC/Rad50
MWSPIGIKIENVGSIRELIYVFNQCSPRFINGLNLSDEGQVSNGSGKSLLPDSLFIALCGEPLRKISLGEIISTWSDKGRVELALENELLQEHLLIVREFTAKKQVVKIYKNQQKEYLPLAGVEEHNKYIIERLEISKEDLKNYYIVHKDNFKNFFLSPDSIQKEIISRFSNSNLLKGIDKIVEEDLSKKKDEITQINNNLISLNSRKQVYQEQIEKINKQDYEKERQDKINKCLNEIKSVKNKILENDPLIKQYNEKTKELVTLKEKSLFDIEELKKELDTIKQIQLNEERINKNKQNIVSKEQQVTALNDPIKEVNLIIKSIDSKISNIEKVLLDVVVCPKCSHSFSFKSPDTDIEEEKNKKIHLEEDKQLASEELENIKKEKDNKEQEIDKIKDENKLLEQEDDKIKKIIRECEKKINEIEVATRSIDLRLGDLKYSLLNIEGQNTQHEGSIKFLEQSIEQEKTRDYGKKEDKIKEIETEIATTDNLIGLAEAMKLERQEIYDYYAEYIPFFKRFQTFLANKTIKSIEGFTNGYLEDFQTKLRVLIEGERTLADNKTKREEIECLIVRDGYEIRKYASFSSGERCKIAIANILCFRKLNNLNCKNGGFGLCQLDEIVESMDGKGIQDLIACLTNVQECIEVITHSSNNVLSIDNVTFVKENGETKLQ